jgi:hypothetical protein
MTAGKSLSSADYDRPETKVPYVSNDYFPGFSSLLSNLFLSTLNVGVECFYGFAVSFAESLGLSGRPALKIQAALPPRRSLSLGSVTESQKLSARTAAKPRYRRSNNQYGGDALKDGFLALNTKL